MMQSASHHYRVTESRLKGGAEAMYVTYVRLDRVAEGVLDLG